MILAVDIYAGVAASLAERKKGGQLTEFFRNIKGTIDDDDWDQVLFKLFMSLLVMLLAHYITLVLSMLYHLFSSLVLFSQPNTCQKENFKALEKIEANA